MKVSRSFLLFLLFNFVYLHSAQPRKKDDRPTVRAREGQTINLSCDRGSVTTDTLYAVKWYKDEKEFFRNYPKAENPLKVYDIEGFTLEQPSPSPWQVTLRNVQPSASGKYTCMVVDYPRYRTIYRSTIVEVASLNDTLHQSHQPHSRGSANSFGSGSGFLCTITLLISVKLMYEIK